MVCQVSFQLAVTSLLSSGNELGSLSQPEKVLPAPSNEGKDPVIRSMPLPCSTKNFLAQNVSAQMEKVKLSKSRFS